MAKLTKDGAYMSVDDAIRDLKEIGAFGSPISDSVLGSITEGKTPDQAKSIREAAGFSGTDIQTLERITIDLKALGFGVDISGSSRTNSISIAGTLDNKPQFKMDVSIDNNGDIVINGMPSANGLVAKLYGKNDLGLTTLASERLVSFEEALRRDSTRKKMLDPNTTDKEKGSYLKWLDKQAKGQSLGLGASRIQSSVFKDIADTMKRSGPNHYRTQWQNGLVYMDGLYDQFKKIDSMWQGPRTTQNQRNRSDSDLNTQLQEIELMYLTLGPEEAARTIKGTSDFKNITQSKAWRTIDSVFTKMSSWGMHQGTLSENGAAFHIAALNNLGRYGELYQPRASRKVNQTNLTALGKQMTDLEKMISGPVFSTTKGNKGTAGNFKLYSRAFVTNDDIKAAYKALHDRKIKEGMSQADFVKKYGSGMESVDVDALLYRASAAPDFLRIEERNDKISKAAIAKALKKKGVSVPKIGDQYDWDALLRDPTTKQQVAQTAIGLSSKYGRDKKAYGRSALNNITFDDSFIDDDFLKIRYDRKSPFKQGKLVAASGTYREAANAINDELFEEILKQAKYDYVGDPSKITFLANKTTGSDTKYSTKTLQPINSVAAKGVGDYVVGYFNHVAHQNILSNMGTATTADSKKTAVSKFYNALFGAGGALSKEAISPEDLKEIQSLFTIADNGQSINWGSSISGDKILRTHTIDLMHALGGLDLDFNGKGKSGNPFAITGIGDQRRLDILKPILLEHEEAIHQPTKYGMALAGEGGYTLQQGYREHDSSVRMLNELARLEVDATKLGNVTSAKKYIEGMYGNTKISSTQYKDIQDAVSLLNEQAWDAGMTEDHIEKLYNSGKKHKAMILDIDKLVADGTFTPGSIDNRLEFSKTDNGLITKQSFNNSNLKKLEDLIATFREENGYTADEANPKMYIKLPNGGLYSIDTGKGIGAGGLAPIFYRGSEKKKGGYLVSPEATDVLALLNTAIGLKTQDVTGLKATQLFGDVYHSYQQDLNEDVFLKGNSTYDQAHKADIAHAIMPQTIGRQSGMFDKELEDAITISAHDAEEMLKQTVQERKLYTDTKDYEGFTRDILAPIYQDIYGKSFELTPEEQKEYEETLRSGALIGKTGKRKGSKTGTRDAAAYKENLVRQKILDAMTLGSEAFANTQGRGVVGMMNRYPSSNGKDTRAAKLFIDSNLGAGEMGGDQKLLDLVNADFDGDHGVVRLWYADGTVVSQRIVDPKTNQPIKPEDRAAFGSSVLAAGRQAINYQKGTNEVYRAIKDREALTSPAKADNQTDSTAWGFMSQEEINSLDKEVDQARTDFLKHYNKRFTGTGSNLYQAITQAMTNAGSDETGTNASRGAAGISAAMVRAFEETFVQNAISSKKVKKSGGNNSQWWKGVNDIYDILNHGRTYTEQVPGEVGGAFKQAYSDMQELGILAKDDSVSGAFAPRIAASILSMVNGQNVDQSTDEGKQNLKDLKNIFGTQFDDSFIKDGRVVGADRLKFDVGTLWRAFQYQNQYNKNDKFIENAVNNRYSLVPGTGNVFLDILKQQTGAIDSDTLEKNGFVIKDGKISLMVDIGMSPQTKETMQKIELGTATLADYAKMVPPLQTQVDNLQHLAGSLNAGKKIGLTNPTSLLSNVFGSPYANFDKDEGSLFRTAYNRYVLGGKAEAEKGAAINRFAKDENGNYPDLTWGMNADDFQTAIRNEEAILKGHYIHGLNELYGDILSQYGDRLSEDDKQLDAGMLAGKLIRDDTLNGGKLYGIDKKDIELYKQKLKEVALQRQELENFYVATATESSLERDPDTGTVVNRLAKTSDEYKKLVNFRLSSAAHMEGVRGLLDRGSHGENKGQLLGSEIPLFGVAGGKMYRGISDAIGVTYDEDGKAHFNIIDYKNTFGGTVTPEQMFQTGLYGQALDQLAEDIRNSKATSFDEYLKLSDNELAKAYSDLVSYQVDPRGDVDLKTPRTEAEKNALMNMYERIFGIVKAENRGNTLLNISSAGGDGFYHMASFKGGLHSDVMRAALGMIGGSGGMFANPEDRIDLEKDAKQHIVNEVRTEIGGYQSTGSAKEESKQLEQQLKLLKEIYELKNKIDDLDRLTRKAEKQGDAVKVHDLQDKAGKLSESLTKKRQALNDAESKGKLNEEEYTTYSKIKEDAKTSYDARKKLLDEDAENSEINDLLKQYKVLARQRTQLQTSIYGDDLKANTVIGAAQRGAYTDRADFSREQLDEVEQAIAAIIKQGGANENFAKGRQEIDDKMSVMLQKGQLNANVQNRGVSTIWGAIGSQFQRTFQYFMNFGAVTKVIQGTMTTLKKVISYAEQLDKSLTNIRIVTGKSTEEVSDMMNGYADLAEDLAVSTSDVANSASEWLRQGYNVSEVNDLVTSTMYLSKLGMIDTDAALKNLTSTMKGFKLEASDSMDIVDKLTTLDINAATTAGEIANALSEFSNTASMAGVNLDQAAAMATTIMDVSQVSGSTAGTSLKTIISRYGNVKAGAYTSMSDSESDDTTDNLNDVEKVLRKVGVSIRDSKNEFRDFDDVLQDLGDIWDTLDSVSQNAIATAFAGKQALCLNV